MTVVEIIHSLEDQAQDTDKLAGDDPESIFTQDAAALREAAKQLRPLRRAASAEGDVGMEIQEAITHARQVADGCGAQNQDCAYQHDKLADWLEELVFYRNTGLSAADIQEAVDLLDETIHPDDIPAELKSWVERCTWHVKKCAELHKEATALAKENADLAGELEAAKRDIAALLWLEGQCHYCKLAKKVEYSGASRWTCKLGSGAECRPEWRGRCQTCP